MMYVKPLMRVNSFVILPPWSWTFFLACSSWSGEAPSLRVTLQMARLARFFRAGQEAHVDSRHVADAWVVYEGLAVMVW